MKNFAEKRIRLNVAILYLIVVVASFCMVLYLFNLHNNIKKQKDNVENHNSSLLITSELILNVNQVQANTAEYLSTKRKEYLKKITKNLSDIEEITNTLQLYTTSASQDSLLREIAPLLNKKTEIVSKIIVELNKGNPIETIHQKLKVFEEEKEKEKEKEKEQKLDSFQVSSVVSDTIIKITKSKGFFQNLFSEKKSADTTITIRTSKVDTLHYSPPTVADTDTLSVFTEVGIVVDKASKGYDKSIKEIRSQIKNLIITDQQISAQISLLLLELYQETLNTTLIEIENTRRVIKEHYESSIIIAASALLMSLLLVILIIRNTNKGYVARLALEEANELNKEIMESRHKLLLSVSHDIKTPLNTILGNLELLQSDKKEFSSIQSAGKHILALLNNLLDFSSMEQGKIQITNSNFNLHQLMLEVSDMFYPLAIQKQIEFSCNFNIDKSLMIHSDALRIKQIIANLLSNAIKYTPEGEVLFSAKYEQEKIYLTVVDSGIGIPAEEQAQIFSPFSRAENSHRVAEGSGLGMYVLKGLVDLLNGKIELESELDKGTKVEVEIPVRTVKIETTLKKKNILVLDDDLAFLDMVQKMLVKLGHKVSTCSDPKAFEKEIENLESYDLILTDLEMNTFSGIDVLKKVKSINHSLPVFIMSARGSDFSDERANILGFDAYLQKPLSINTLYSLIGGKMKKDAKFDTLNELFEGDEEAIRKILEVFVNSTRENIESLKQNIKDDDFETAQSLCHKMLTMFIQLEAEEAVIILKEMDALRGKDASACPEWKEKIEKLIKLSEKLIKEIENL